VLNGSSPPRDVRGNPSGTVTPRGTRRSSLGTSLHTEMNLMIDAIAEHGVLVAAAAVLLYVIRNGEFTFRYPRRTRR
jgi:hypothetical protein